MSNTQDITQSRSFCDFYRDETLFGHSLLVPSIYVVDSYQRIFSEVKQEGCDALIEVISRIVLFVILPVIAVICLVVTPIGLICKACVSLCCAPPEFMRKPQEISRQESPRLVKEKEIDAALKKAQNIVSSIRLADIDKKKLAEARQLIDTVLPQVKQDGECFDLSPRVYYLIDRIENLEFELSRPGNVSIRNTFKGKIEVPTKGDGNCIHTALGLVSSKYVDPGSMRHQLTTWIEENYPENIELQRHLVNALIEHTVEKVAKLEEEQKTCKTLEPDHEISTGTQTEADEQYANAQTRLKEIPGEIEELTNLVILAAEAVGGANVDHFDFDHIKDKIPKYIDELRLEGVYGGLPEAYAYSMIHKVCVKVFRKFWDDENKKWELDENPFQIFQETLETKQRPARELTFESNHYNPLFPKEFFEKFLSK